MSDIEKTSSQKDDLVSLLNQCDRCGACTRVCPLYEVNALDRATARGKLALAKAYLTGVIPEGDKTLQEAMEYCLLCGACSEVCPSHIMTADAMVDMRQRLGQKYGYSLFHRALSRGMASRGLRALGRLGIAAAQKMAFPRLTGGLLPSDPLAPSTGHPGPALLQSRERPTGGRSLPAEARQLAYFTGCAMGLFFPKAADASVRTLTAAGFQVDRPQVDCCGLPQLAHGLADTAKALAKENIQTLEAYDLIVTDCGSCASSLQGYPALLADEADWALRATALSQKIWSFSEILVAAGYHPAHRDLRVTYHDSCHLNRGLGVHEAPRQLLTEATDYIEMDRADRCCGGSGSFGVEHPAISKKILALKEKDARATGADVLVAECPSCLMQLGKMAGDGLQVMHLSQVICPPEEGI
ncbi:(Fe-S)-binding protein [Peptococcus simiae]|uniref:Glycolate oxidase iron-sulfur subunit n=1 Tax=Peptococcus simiae TaxID=1643805 RepID=A0ABW9H114_9FIRM